MNGVVSPRPCLRFAGR